MIQLDNTHRPAQAVIDQLGKWQAEVVGEFPVKVQIAAELWKAKNTKGNPTFKAVKATLTKLCSGARRCIYCEDSVADEIDHFWPKALYPGKTFDWDSFNYACTNCNRPKWMHFGVFDPISKQAIDLSRHDGKLEPPIGEPILINPRQEDPMDFAILDLGITFMFFMKPGLSEADAYRFQYTYEKVLKLNHTDREHLMVGRRQAFHNFKNYFFRLFSLVAERADPKKLSPVIEAIRRA